MGCSGGGSWEGSGVTARRHGMRQLTQRHVREKTMLSTLGKVNWAVRPSGGAGPFLAGAYQTVQRAAGGMVDFQAWQTPASALHPIHAS